QLLAEVNRAAAMLQSLGVKKGERVIVYMPMIPEAAFAILACARLGAIHSVVFGGFAAASLAARIDDARPALMITADGGSRMGKTVLYKSLVDESLELAKHAPKKVLIHPDAGVWWKIVQDYKVAVMFSAPTAIRVLKKHDVSFLRKYELGSLKHLFLAGEPLDEPTHRWISEALGRPVIDHYWQTET